VGATARHHQPATIDHGRIAPVSASRGEVQQGGGRFMRRGLRACQAEWKLLCGTHNLLKLWRTTTATS
jgi:hypothetical protein